MLKHLYKDLRQLADPDKAKILQGFFKTGKGQYGEGDVFLGIVVPNLRKLVKKYADELSLTDTEKLITSKFHEERLIGLLVLVHKYRKARDPRAQAEVYKFYLSHTKYINNWDLVDLTAPKIVGPYLEEKSKTVLYRLAKSKNLWERRIAILSTFHYIYQGQPEETLKIAHMLLHDTHDLIHKAVGWMLREVGKRCGEAVEEDFLKPRYKTMPRTMLRYAIERFPEKKYRAYLA